MNECVKSSFKLCYAYQEALSAGQHVCQSPCLYLHVSIYWSHCRGLLLCPIPSKAREYGN